MIRNTGLKGARDAKRSGPRHPLFVRQFPSRSLEYNGKFFATLTYKVAYAAKFLTHQSKPFDSKPVTPPRRCFVGLAMITSNLCVGRAALQVCMRSKAYLAIVVLLASVSGAVDVNARAAEAYIERKGDAWTIGTATVERKIELKGGRLVSTSWRDKKTGQQLLPEGTVSDEIRVTIGWTGVRGRQRMGARASERQNPCSG